MKYYPLECVDKMLETEPPEKTLQMMKDKGMCDPDSTVADLEDYTFDLFFFTPEYKGKFEKWNNEIMYNTMVNKLFFPMYSIKDFDKRCTEWKDVLTTNLVLSIWMKSKMVYKIDNDFFHEIKQTENVITSKETFDKLPFKCFFIDLTEVDNIANFKGAWVYITTDDIHGNKDFYSVNIYMVQNNNFTFFTYYSWYKFTEEQQEVEWHSDDLPKSDFIARTFVDEDDLITKDIKSLLDNPTDYTKKGLIDVTLDMRDEYDPRDNIVVSIFQIMSFIAIDASDVSESNTTKSTYKPRKENAPVKNKFSEVKIWDVGVRYGKAIRVAKQEYKRHNEKSNGSIETKDRKPVRPHIRRPHWHKYYIGKGRKETKTIWMPPIYVCGNGKEIPVTIREVKK